MPIDGKSNKSAHDAATSARRGERAFAAFDYAIKVVKVTVVVLGITIAIIALSGVDMARLDEHEVFRYRMIAVPAVIVAYLLVDLLVDRRRADRARRAERLAEAQANGMGAQSGEDQFVLSVDPERDRRAAALVAAQPATRTQNRRGFAAEFLALAIIAAGAGAFWHDDMTHDLPNPVAVTGKFVSAKCFDRSLRSIATSGPYMSIAYEFPSRSTHPRTAQITCLLEKCEPEMPTSPPLDTEYNRVSYPTLQDCRAALPTVLTSKAPATVWVGDKDPNAAVRARFTPERHAPPYFLLWIPGLIAAVTLLASGFMRLRR